MKVSPIMLLKRNIEEMSETGHAIICMKTMHIEDERHYIYENKSGYWNRRGERKRRPWTYGVPASEKP